MSGSMSDKGRSFGAEQPTAKPSNERASVEWPRRASQVFHVGPVVGGPRLFGQAQTPKLSPQASPITPQRTTVPPRASASVLSGSLVPQRAAGPRPSAPAPSAPVDDIAIPEPVASQSVDQPVMASLAEDQPVLLVEPVKPRSRSYGPLLIGVGVVGLIAVGGWLLFKSSEPVVSPAAVTPQDTVPMSPAIEEGVAEPQNSLPVVEASPQAAAPQAAAPQAAAPQVVTPRAVAPQAGSRPAAKPRATETPEALEAPVIVLTPQDGQGVAPLPKTEPTVARPQTLDPDRPVVTKPQDLDL